MKNIEKIVIKFAAGRQRKGLTQYNKNNKNDNIKTRKGIIDGQIAG